MRLIDADLLVKKLRMLLKDFKNAPTKKYVIKIILSMLGDKNQMPTIEAEAVKYQPMSKDFARMITKGIASFLSELQLDLPSIIYEDIESNLLKGKFADVECFIKNYIENNGAKMDEEKECQIEKK